MKTINLEVLQEFLENESIHYKIMYGDRNKKEINYVFSSLFAPLKEGFYFYIGDKIPDEIENSLVLIGRDIEEELLSDSKNIFCRVNGNPQIIYYKIMNELFGEVSTGIISSLAQIHPEAELGTNVQIDPFCIIGKVRLGDNCIIKSHTTIFDNTIIDNNTTIETHSAIGARGVAWTWNEEETKKIVQPQLGGVHIKEACFLGANTIIVRGSINENTIIGENTLFAPGCRIGHGSIIGDYVHFANGVVTGGNTVINKHSFVGSSVVFRPKVKIHEYTIVGAGSTVVKDTTSSKLTLMGVPAKEFKSKVNPKGMPKPKK